ncbi:ELMO domain-containing protein [Aphelenchoides besseyi]|nr:ELMO domain-containing protein [Aphelenchoides besseyi]
MTFNILLRTFVSLINGFNVMLFPRGFLCLHLSESFTHANWRLIQTANSRLTAAERTERVEKLLFQSENSRIREIDWDSGAETSEAESLLHDDYPDSEQRADMAKLLAVPMRQIRGQRKLKQLIEQKRSTAYDSMNEEHEKMLHKLWSLLKPNEELTARKTNQWQDIGFQGDDPSTDFRGMGILGLENLLFYAQYDVENCRRVMRLSEHNVYGFPFAICGITITALCRELLINGLLRNHFSNSSKEAPTIDNFHQVYCHVFNLFGDYWAEKQPESVMYFNEVKNEFVDLLERYLKKNKADLSTTDISLLSVLKR